MILCLDSGNTRVKWGVHDGRRWLAQGAVAHGELAPLGEALAYCPRPEKILLANVAGPAVADAIAQVLSPAGCPITAVVSEAARAGVRNGYRNPGQLGVDRWCALIGARSLSPMATLVVMAGTAVTVDTLDADGQFLGGLILPGRELMRRALARDTAALPLAEGVWVEYPQCTDDAIVSGLIEAHAGAIARAFERLPRGRRACLISGGDAAALLPHLSHPAVKVDNLPLEGLRAIAFSD